MPGLVVNAMQNLRTERNFIFAAKTFAAEGRIRPRRKPAAKDV